MGGEKGHPKLRHIEGASMGIDIATSILQTLQYIYYSCCNIYTLVTSARMNKIRRS